MAKLLQRLGAFSVRRRRLVLAGWLVLLVAIGGLAMGFKGTFSDKFSVPGTESQAANELISERIPGANASAASGKVVFAAKSGETLTSGDDKAAIEQTVAALAKVKDVSGAPSPFAAKTVSQDGRIAYTNVSFSVVDAEVTPEITDAIEQATAPARAAGLQVEYGGAAAATEADAPIGEVLGIVIALLVLTITFGSMAAAGMPLLVGIIGVAFSALIVTFASGFVDLTSTSLSLSVMLGLAVGIDYTLFVVSRHRSQVHDGEEIDASIAHAVGTAGSAVVFAGSTVIVALLALWVTGVPFLGQLGLGAVFAVAFAVALSLTFVPALLAVLGKRAVKGKTFSQHAIPEDSKEKHSMGARWIAFVLKGRVAAILLVTVGLLALASPALNMRLGLPNDGTANPDKTERKAYDLLSTGFGAGFNGPLTVVADLKGVSDPQAAADSVAKELGGLKDVVTVAPAILNQDKNLGIISVIPKSGPSAEATTDLVKAIRDQAAAIKSDSGATVSVTGETATNIDISDKMSAALLPYISVVVILAVILLMIAFQSVLVPITAIAGFLLTIAASFGFVTLVFQHGFLAGLFGIPQTGPLVSLLPILIIGVIFGLAMDYQVFLVSRMREEFSHGASPVNAVRDGFRQSARVVTAAALIMIAVFSGFILPEDPIIKSIGLAFATGIIIDAFLIRMTLIPALMSIMGARAWWMPAWLGRIIPKVDIEGAELDKQAAPREERELVGAESGR
jgi:RND superfamily putative drug exporter